MKRRSGWRWWEEGGVRPQKPKNKLLIYKVTFWLLESELELFTGDTSKEDHSPGPMIRDASP